MHVLKLCTFPSRLTAEITRNRNGHTRSVKCSHFGIFSVVNRPYFVSQTIPYNVEVYDSSRNTTRDAFMNNYIHVRELIFRLSRDVSLGRLCSNSLIASATTTSRNLTSAPRGCKIACFRIFRLGGLPHLPGVPHLHVNRPLQMSKFLENFDNGFQS